MRASNPKTQDTVLVLGRNGQLAVRLGAIFVFALFILNTLPQTNNCDSLLHLMLLHSNLFIWGSIGGFIDILENIGALSADTVVAL